jgi:hypothetical protein
MELCLYRSTRGYKDILKSRNKPLLLKKVRELFRMAHFLEQYLLSSRPLQGARIRRARIGELYLLISLFRASPL